MSELDEVFVEDLEEYVETLDGASRFSLPFTIQRECSFCGRERHVQPKARTKHNFDENGGQILVRKGCGGCGDELQEMARSMFLTESIAEIGSEEYLNLYWSLRNAQKEVVEVDA